MTITPPLVPHDRFFNRLANRMARELWKGFGYPLREAEQHIWNYFHEYEQALPFRRRKYWREDRSGFDWTARLLFFHDESALVLDIGYSLAGGAGGLDFLDWRSGCWEALWNGRRIPLPRNLRKNQPFRVMKTAQNKSGKRPARAMQIDEYLAKRSKYPSSPAEIREFRRWRLRLANAIPRSTA